MKRFSILSLTFVFVVMLVLFSKGAMAQYTGEFIFCTDPTTPDSCRATAIPGVDWDRRVLGNIVCAGVGFVPQDTDCDFTAAAFSGYDCNGGAVITFPAFVPAGWDLATACTDTTGAPPGNYSSRAIDNSCFGGQSPCGNIRLDVPPPPCDPQVLYDAALTSAQEGVDAGWLPQETVDYLVEHADKLSHNCDALIRAIRSVGGARETTAPEGDQLIVPLDGGMVEGPTWTTWGLLGPEVLTTGRAEVQVVWNNNAPHQCDSWITGHHASGATLLGNVTSRQVGTSYTRNCPGTCGGRSPTRQCGQFNLIFTQGFRWFSQRVEMGLDEICADCP